VKYNKLRDAVQLQAHLRKTPQNNSLNGVDPAKIFCSALSKQSAYPLVLPADVFICRIGRIDHPIKMGDHGRPFSILELLTFCSSESVRPV
jgi:hypothetical protein